MLLAQKRISQKIWLSMCLLAMLGSQGIIVKIYSRYLFEDWICDKLLLPHYVE